MAYRIEYKAVRGLQNRNRYRCRRAAITGLLFVLFITEVWFFWPEGKSVLQGILFSGDVAVTVAALDDFAHQLGEGIAIKDAFIRFCKQIVTGG